MSADPNRWAVGFLEPDGRTTVIADDDAGLRATLGSPAARGPLVGYDDTLPLRAILGHIGCDLRNLDTSTVLPGIPVDVIDLAAHDAADADVYNAVSDALARIRQALGI